MKVSMKAAATAAALVLGLARLAATDTTPPAAAPSYDIQGKYYETCACSVSCPCASNATLPTEGHCDAISLVHIDKGTVGDTKLDGLNVALVFRSPKGKKVKDSFEQGEMDFFTAYLDDKATAKQKAVMPDLMASLFGKAEIKGTKPPQWVPMSLDTQGDIAKFQIAGGSKLSFETENINVGDKTKAGNKAVGNENRIVLTNSAPFPWVHDITQGISRHFKYADLGTSWEYKERNAFFGTVSANN
jgi:hypothetical protein